MQGFVVPEWDQPARGADRKVSRVTAGGEERVVELTTEWRGFSAGIETILSGQEPEEEAR